MYQESRFESIGDVVKDTVLHTCKESFGAWKRWQPYNDISNNLPNSRMSFFKRIFVLDISNKTTTAQNKNVHTNPKEGGLNKLEVINVTRLFGVNQIEDGKNIDSVSICWNVYGVIPCVYVLACDNINNDTTHTIIDSSWLNTFKEKLDIHVEQKIKSNPKKYENYIDQNKSYLSNVQIIPKHEGFKYKQFMCSRSSIPPTSQRLLKLHFTLHRYKKIAIEEIQRMSCNGHSLECYDPSAGQKYMKTCQWYEIRESADVDICKKSSNETDCQVEVNVHFTDIIEVDDYSPPPPIRVLSFDIEIWKKDQSRDLTSGRNSIIQISSVIYRYNFSCDNICQDAVIGKTVFVLGSCESIPDCKILQFKPNKDCTEERLVGKNMDAAELMMILTWQEFINLMDPDVIIGYNITQFDLPCFFNRCRYFEHELNFQSASLFGYLGRIKGTLAKILDLDDKECIYNRSYAQRKFSRFQGRVIIDLLLINLLHDVTKNMNQGFKLREIAKRYIPDKESQKKNILHMEIPHMHLESRETRHYLAEYCLNDALIPLKLLFVDGYANIDSKTRILDFKFAQANKLTVSLHDLCNKNLKSLEMSLESNVMD